MARRPEASEAALPLSEATPTFTAPADWRAIDLISDLHLAERMPRTFAAWRAHLRHSEADAVFILGDLFEAWIGDDLAERDFESRCVEVLAEAAATKCIAFMAGNRDFLVGDALLESSGVLRLQDPTLVEAFDQPVLLSHGDALCLGDVAYQRFRSVVRRPGLQRAFLSLPLSWRRGLGQAARRRSAKAQQPGPHPRFDVDAGAAGEWLGRAGADILVHGHTHAPATHALGDEGVRHVLSDWDLDTAVSPRAEVLRWTAAGFERLPPQVGATGA